MTDPESGPLRWMSDDNERMNNRSNRQSGRNLFSHQNNANKDTIDISRGIDSLMTEDSYRIPSVLGPYLVGAIPFKPQCLFPILHTIDSLGQRIQFGC